MLWWLGLWQCQVWVWVPGWLRVQAGEGSRMDRWLGREGASHLAGVSAPTPRQGVGPLYLGYPSVSAEELQSATRTEWVEICQGFSAVNLFPAKGCLGIYHIMQGPYTVACSRFIEWSPTCGCLYRARLSDFCGLYMACWLDFLHLWLRTMLC